MNEITKEIFEFLNVEPDEIFRIEGSTNYFKINKDLQLYLAHSQKNVFKKLWELCGPHLTISNLLVGKATIEKIIYPTEKEQIAINYAKACGCNWLAKDKNNKIYAYEKKPVKTHYEEWVCEKISDTSILIKIPISFLSWNDTEPYYIGDEKEE